MMMIHHDEANSAATTLQVAGTADPMRIGRVELIARDLDRVATFYRETIGLVELERDSRRVTLGVGTTPLLILRREPDARQRRREEAGLFHTAFLLPQRADLGRWLNHTLTTGIRLTGASDHLVSEAIYLDDPEGNGVEIYVDRPRAQWTWRDGEVHMVSDPLDLAALAAVSGDWTGAPDATRIGHVHLQVGDLAQAQQFYAGVVGFNVTCRYAGALFLASGGYHHHVAVNIWNSRGAPAPDRPVTGLASFEILASNAASIAPGVTTLTDPWGVQVAIGDAS